MSFHPFRKIRVPPGSNPTAKQINDMQDNIGHAVGQITGKDVLDITLLKDITLLPGIVNKVPHTLGRNIQGFIPISNQGYTIGIESVQDSNPSPDLFIYLTAPAQMTVNILVF